MALVDSQTLETVQYVDLNRYAGKWYEIASYPKRFERKRICTSSLYTTTEKGYLVVENRCIIESSKVKKSYLKGKVFVEENSGNSKLNVQFFWPFKAKYWIIELANDYSYSVVSHPHKKYLWILCRTPQMEDVRFCEILNRIRDKGFDINKLQITKQ